MTREEVISKIRKLFELSKSSNEHEAALAASKAREMLARHNLSMADLPAEAIQNALEVAEASISAGRVLRNWVKGLLVHVGQGFQCEHLIRRRAGRSPLLTFVGASTDAEVAVYTFQFLYRELNRLVERSLPQLRRENRGWSATSLRYAYLDGAVKRIGEKFQEYTQPIREVEDRLCTDLVVAKEAIVRDYLTSTYPHIKVEYSRARTISARAFHKGYNDADKIELRSAVSARGRSKSLASA